MGTEAFPQLLFDKVYKDDITRLRSMEEMWTNRRPPEALDYATLSEKASEVMPVDALLKEDQRAWTLEENLVVFRDRYVIQLPDYSCTLLIAPVSPVSARG
jgi:ubiquitin-like 1-activating enzyme E1 B